MSLLSRFANVFRGQRLDKELDDELIFHLEERVEDLVGQGWSQGDARREAGKLVGNPLLLRESSRDVKLLPWLESIVHDVRFGVRILWKRRMATAAAVLSLSIAIGACTAAFSLLDALVLRPLPLAHPEQLVYLSYLGRNTDSYFSYSLFTKLRDASKGDADLFGIVLGGGLAPVMFGGAHGETERVRLQSITGNAFSVLGVKPELGRLLTGEDDAPTNRDAAVLSYGYWMRRFGGNPAVLGQSLDLNGKRFHIAGVAQKGFSGVEPGYLTDVWISALSLVPERALQDPDSGWATVWGRLRESASRERTQQELQATFTNFRRQQVRAQFQRGAPRVAIAAFLNAPLTLRPAARGHDSLFRWQFERPLWILAVFAGLLLLIACSNVANLFIAQTAAREREMAMRISVGAGRRRLIRQMLIESALIACAAFALGLALASFMEQGIVGVLAPTDFPIYLDLRLDWRVLTFSAAAGLLTALLFGSAPAWRASAVRPDAVLKSGGFGGSSRIGPLRPLLALQILFSVAVLFVANLLLLSFRKLTTVNLGFAKDGVILFTIDAKNLEGEPARIAQLQLLDRVRRIGGVQSASFSGTGLIGGPYQWIVTPAIKLPGRDLDRNGPSYLEVSPGFFDTMRIRLPEGRDLVSRDTEPTSPSVIVNQAFAARYLPGENPLGKRFELQGDDPKPVLQEIVGVAANAKYNNVREDVRPTVYAPLRTLNGSTLEVRAAGNPVSVIPALRKGIERMDPRIRVSSVTLESTRIDNTLVSERLLALISAFFAGAALILAAVGIYGVMSYSSARRTKEIGIRITLGAQRFAVVHLIVRDFVLVSCTGVLTGAAAGWGLSRLIASLLYEVRPAGFWSLMLPVGCLLLAGVIAALLPVLRAVRVDPAVALRYE